VVTEGALDGGEGRFFRFCFRRGTPIEAATEIGQEEEQRANEDDVQEDDVPHGADVVILHHLVFRVLRKDEDR